ncbi:MULTISPECIES: LacI family DNA-binding transcriptional regulator [Rhizobium]|uniref:LacI family DNA-binding transcriptional regulator n=1 Tax=Rhizobium TaxID=379 RepID=UPI001C9001E9|nr:MULTISPECIES: LacI family DNA-binding transcriptional regulator [Rhizobium]MBY3135007.1 LacI family DNA-binding transcriptional regulator [Rhizobium laguerreae]MBY5583480.1 LacI family DNA-binding transcriptional regulator [Rhizobium leguminosarum]MBY5625228.1 LacI family DNA-binding transcriptional regulator [Rhizobium leguminosarum]MBY5644865.1 LacI family DNA-binding transcriptional regulator [Rhizobium leguminosarum]MBY5765517.1 LacI family DNA-binding transcriptional regulator [Rhizobi
MKVTLKDVATQAGVGTATVERVLNGRGGVRPETVEKVFLAARRLEYRQSLPVAHRGLIRIEVILVRPETSFYSRLNRAFERIAASLDDSIVVHRTFVRENEPAQFARYIANPAARRSALIVVAPDHADVVTSVRKAAGLGIPVVQIMTRPAPELPYVGIDNYAAGRTAAHYMSGMLAQRPGSFVALCHSGAYENHKERIRGFSSYVSDNASNEGSNEHRFIEVMFDLDDEHNAIELLQAALRREPGIIGVYSAGGDNKGVARVLAANKTGRPFWVGHELTEQTQDYLRRGIMSIVLDQAPEVQARRSIDLALNRLGLIEVEVSAEPVRFLTITPENL